MLNENLKALDAFLKVIRINPHHTLAWYKLGMYYNLHDQPLNAVWALKKNLENEKDNALSWYYLGINLNKLGNLQKGISSLKKALLYTLPPTQDFFHQQDIWYQLGKAYKYQEKFKLAIHSFNRALKIDPQFTQAWLMLASIYRKQAKHTKVIACLQKLTQIAPENPRYWEFLAEYYQDVLGQKDKAAACFEKIALLNSTAETR